MAKICALTGRKTQTGNNVSHANNHTRRKFKPNIKVKKVFLPSEGKFVKIKVSTKGIKILNKIGIEKAIKKAAARI